MKKLMLLVIGSALFATSAVAEGAKTQKTAEATQTELGTPDNHEMRAVLANGTLWGITNLSNGIGIQAYNTSTHQTYYLTVHANDAKSISLPFGTYDIFVNTNSVLGNIYLSDYDDSYSVTNVYSHTFYNITINSSSSTVIDAANP